MYKYTVMLVEDEPIIREGMELFINWDSLGYQLVSSLSDGKEALEYLEQNAVDVIITDIEMTFVSGIALAKYIYEKNILTKVIILTAYSSFDYISECMKYKVEDYLLKTAPTTEIEEKLKLVYTQLETDRLEKERQSKLENWVTNVVPYLKEQFLKKLINGGFHNEEEIIGDVRRSGVELDLRHAKAALYKLEFDSSNDEVFGVWKYGYEGFCNAIHNFFDRFDETRHFFYLIDKTVLILELNNDLSDMTGMEQEFQALFKISIRIKPIAVYDSVFEVKAPAMADEDKEHSSHYIISSVLSYIDEHIKDDITLETISKSVYVSPEYLSRLFKKEIGMNFKEYIIKSKMMKAMELLKNPKYKVYEISELLGYKSVGFFSKVFREYTNFSPTEYRNNEL